VDHLDKVLAIRGKLSFEKDEALFTDAILFLYNRVMRGYRGWLRDLR
jgi:hypothetical protein